MLQRITRPDAFRFHNGEKAKLPFTTKEYERRLNRLRKIMARMDLPAVLLTSMHNMPIIPASCIAVLAAPMHAS